MSEKLSPIPFRRKWLAVVVAACCCVPGVLAQQAAPEVATTEMKVSEQPATQDDDLRYVGAPYRVGVGYQSKTHWRGELFWAFHETEKTSWIGEIYATSTSAAGGRLSFHWQPADDNEASVRKLFAAIDQNRHHDRKVTFGGGLENEHWFGSAYGSAGITGRRKVDDRLFSSTTTNTGVDNNHAWS